MNSVIYLTGAPATGKSTLSRNLRRRIPELEVFAYSEKLAEYVRERASLKELCQDEIRQRSAQLVTREDVSAVDAQLIQLVRTRRGQVPILIDSHAVTKESFGFRVTPFTKAELATLSPDIILCLYADGESVAARIKANPMGRPLPSIFELDLHTHLQTTVAMQYALQLDRPIYFLDASAGEEALVDAVLDRMGAGPDPARC